MTLSEYRRRLDKIARQCQKQGIDPEMICNRYSDYELVSAMFTVAGFDTPSGTAAPKRGEYPALVTAHEVNGGLHLMRTHASMTDEQKAQSKLYVLVSQGN